ncbi:MAG: hypothetical protein ACT4QA_00035 [Panacagrimonas sp.]
MAQDYQPRRFFRHAPNRLLKRYFFERGALAEVDFGELSETQVEPIYAAWLALSDEVRKPMEQDFRDIDELASEAGTKAILDEAEWHGEDLQEQFAKLGGFHERAFWTLLERPKYWPGALHYSHADSVSPRYWRKRKNLPRKAAAVDEDSVRELEVKIGAYFHTKEGRGRNCKVECYRRGEQDYFFAYPEDYAQADVEWGRDGLRRLPRRPAFEVIFVYTQAEGTLDLYIKGDRKLVPSLQAIFAEVILKGELGPDAVDERVYDLSPMRARDFQFVYGPESGIAHVAMNKLRLTVAGRKERIVLEADPTYEKLAVFDLLDKVAKGIPTTQLLVTQVGVKVTFAFNPKVRRPQTRSFEINWPNSCSLKHDGRDDLIRKMLADSGIEPRPTTPDAAQA